jgi:signal transduction histidine kinase
LIRWILETKWVPEISLLVLLLAVFGGINAVTGGIASVLGTIPYALASLFVRNYSFLSGALLFVGAALHLGFSQPPSFGDLVLAVVAFVAGVFTKKPWRSINILAVGATSFLIVASASYNPNLSLPNLGIIEFSETGRLVLFTLGSILAASLIGLAAVGGRLVREQYLQKQFQGNRKYSSSQQDEISLELAEQAKRFEMAGDMNESAVQHISSVITNAEAGLYTAKLDPDAGLRALDKVLLSAKAAHAELRRLYETINRGTMISTAPPTLESIPALELAMRAAGFNMAVSYSGSRVALDSSMELAIYRIVFEAIKNVRQHNPKGTTVTAELTWFETSLQLMIRDNGVEVVRKSNVGPNGLPAPYDANDDIDNLLEKVVGPGITAMRERVESFGGSLEAQRVVGVGFTVSALFPIVRPKQER